MLVNVIDFHMPVQQAVEHEARRLDGLEPHRKPAALAGVQAKEQA